MSNLQKALIVGIIVVLGVYARACYILIPTVKPVLVESLSKIDTTSLTEAEKLLLHILLEELEEK